MTHDFSFQINKDRTDQNKISHYYTLVGDHDSLDKNDQPISKTESKKVLAKKVEYENRTKYYIKVGTYGKIYNPIGLYSEGHVNKFLSKIGKKAFEFQEVNSKTFDFYLSFLKTKNLAWLHNAEREMN
jgi:hypothetical protein